jgi:hypothetical protein
VAELASAVREKSAKKIVGKELAKARALLQPDQAIEKPMNSEFIVNDATGEGPGEPLAVNPWGTLACRDEIDGTLTSLDRQDQEGSRAFYLTDYDGDKGHTALRIARGEISIPRVASANYLELLTIVFAQR